MLRTIEASHEDFDGDRLCNNLEIIVEYARENEKVNDEVFLSLIKLTDHIGLEIKRDRELENRTFETINASQKVLESMKSYDAKMEESQGMVRRFQIEMVAILGIFAAIVMAFSGGLDILSGSISISGESDIFRVVFVVLLCALIMFNVLAFLLYMILAIISLNYSDGGRRPVRQSGLRKSIGDRLDRIMGGRFVLWFDVAILLGMGIDVIAMHCV